MKSTTRAPLLELEFIRTELGKGATLRLELLNSVLSGRHPRFHAWIPYEGDVAHGLGETPFEALTILNVFLGNKSIKVLPVEEDGNEVFTKATTCSRCRTGFRGHGDPIYQQLEVKDGFLVCPRCGGSYGPA